MVRQLGHFETSGEHREGPRLRRSNPIALDAGMQRIIYGERSPSQTMPEKKLQLRFLRDAVRAYLKYKWVRSAKAQQQFADEEEWFSSLDVDNPFSFENVCDELKLSASAIRARLFSTKKPRKRRKPKPRPKPKARKKK